VGHRPHSGGGGNWGGSFLTIPKQGKNQQEAYKLAEWLTAPEQTLKIFRPPATSLPGGAVRQPRVLALKNDFFSGAPVGEIFTGTAGACSRSTWAPRTVRPAGRRERHQARGTGEADPRRRLEQGDEDAKRAAA
jgi:hypothetical protein